MKRRLEKTFVTVTLLLVCVALMVHASILKTDLTADASKSASLSSADPILGWSRTYGGSGNEVAYSVVQTSDGGFALAGSTDSFGAGGSDFWLVKTDSAGVMQWNKTYGGSGNEVAYSVVQTSDGGFALAGSTDSFGAGGSDFWLVKTDSAGVMQWNKTYGGSGNDDALSIIQTSDGGYALAGDGQSLGPDDFWLVKTDSVGNMQWNQTYGGGIVQFSAAYSVVQTNDGGYALAGYASINWQKRFWLVKTDSAGNMQWNQNYAEHTTDSANSVIQTTDGGYAVAGWAEIARSGFGSFVKTGFWLVKTDLAGVAQWNQTYGMAPTDSNASLSFSVVQTTDKGYALAGKKGSLCWLVKTDSAGLMQWNQTYGGTGFNIAYSLVQTHDGGYVLGGATSSYRVDGYDSWLTKTDEMGNFHDIGVTGVASEKTVVGQGSATNITATLVNKGTYAETFGVVVYVNMTIIETAANITLAGEDSINLTFTWNTTGFTEQNYTLSAYADPVPGEADITDNNLTGGYIIVSKIGDITGGTPNPWDFVPDGKVDGKDIAIVAMCFGSAPGCPPPYIWNPNSDVNNDAKVDGKDIALVAAHYGQAGP